ncbi:MAG: hypothetical protein R3F02_13625 [Thiolinea sp.]
MKTKSLATALFILSLCAVTPALQAADNWREVLNKSGIVLSQRDLPGKTYQQIQGQMTLKGRIDALVGILNNPGLCKQWLNGCLASNVVKQINPAERINYTVVDVPFPFQDRDMHVRSKASYDSKTDTVTIALQGIDNYAGAQQNRVRVKSLNGFWRFRQLDEQQVSVSYQMYSDPGITPVAAVNSFSADSLFKTFSNLRQLASSPAHRGVRFSPAELKAITVR